MIVRIFVVAASLLLLGCTDDNFKKGGRDILGGICAGSSNCTVNCEEGKTADRYGRCSFNGGG